MDTLGAVSAFFVVHVMPTAVVCAGIWYSVELAIWAHSEVVGI